MFETVVTGKPLPEVEWYHGIHTVTPGDRVTVEVDGDTHRLVMRECDVRQSGTIRVTATNKAGYNSTDGSLTVQGAHVINHTLLYLLLHYGFHFPAERLWLL